METFSWNRRSKSHKKLLYNGRNFLTPLEKFETNLPIYSEHPIFLLEKTLLFGFQTYLFDTLLYFSTSTSNSVTYQSQQQEYDNLETKGIWLPIKLDMPDNSFWNAVIKHYRNSIHIIFIGFFSFTNQWFITGSGPPSIFVSVISSAVWTANCEQGIQFRKFRELWVSHWFLRELSVTELCKTCQFPEIYFPWNLSRNLYIGHLVIADTFSSKQV